MRRVTAVGALAIALSCGVAGAATPTMRDVLQASYAVRELSAVALSPDGDAVAWQESFHDPRRLLESPRQEAVYVRSVARGARIHVTAGSPAAYYDEENPVWSPDGRSLAFLSDARSKGQLQVFVASATGTQVRRLGRLRGDVQRLTWSPNGKALAVLYIPGASREAGALAPGARDVGVIGSKVDEQRLTTLDVSSGAMHWLTPSDSYIYEYAWSPDGRQIAVTYAKGNGDDNWWIARLARVDVATGAIHDLLVPAFQIADPQWSPDGGRIAIIGGIMSDFIATGGDVYVVDAYTGESRDVTDGAPMSGRSLRWNDATSIDLIAHLSGEMHLMRLDVARGTTSLTTLVAQPESLSSWSSAKGGAIVAVVRASFTEPPEIWAGAPSALRRLTSSNAGAELLNGKAVSLRWKSDQYTPQGWLIYPLDYDPSRRYPMVTIVHGGPSSDLGSVVWKPQRQRALVARLFRLHAQSARQLWLRRNVHAGQHQGLRLRRLARRPRRR